MDFFLNEILENDELKTILSKETARRLQGESIKRGRNIVRFMKLWTRMPFENDVSAQAVERIFGFGHTIDDIAVFPENTSLQKRVKEFLLNGGTLDITAGYRKI